MKILHVVGARPNFMKASPVWKAIEKNPDLTQYMVHTGQHYDANMSKVFFEDLGLKEPDFNLEVGSASHAVQTATIMIRFEKLILDLEPEWVLVYGDVNSTVAAAMVCSKLSIKIAHVEAGLRSYDRRMPEEINRLITDQIVDFLFPPSQDGYDNLIKEGVSPDKIKVVGNVMIDTLVDLKPKAQERWNDISKTFGLEEKKFILVTLHRPSNVDNLEHLENAIKAIEGATDKVEVLFPVHPRTRKQIDKCGIDAVRNPIKFIGPLGYLDFLAMQMNALAVVTDSGGLQEESTYLGIPCLTLRENTERPVTVTVGTNTLIGRDLDLLETKLNEVLDGKGKQGEIPDMWDGGTSQRIVDELIARS